MAKTKRDYEIGHGKPPQHSKWKPGRSGNPRGRPKGSKNTRTLLKEMLDQKIAFTENGQPKEGKYREILVKRLVAAGMSGSVNDMMKVFKLVENYLPEELADSDALKTRVEIVLVDPKDEGDGKSGNDSDGPDDL